MATLGGNLVTASPAGDTLPPLYVLQAQVEVRSRRQVRRTPIADFIKGPGQVDLAPGEVVAGVWLCRQPEFNLHHFEKVGRRRALAIAMASLAALLEVGSKGVVRQARLAWGSLGPHVITSKTVEEALEGNALTLENLDRAGQLARQSVQPIDDVRASASYRRQMSGLLLQRLANCTPISRRAAQSTWQSVAWTTSRF
jgi:xanthine dehydrogenase FAD-binding subunit